MQKDKVISYRTPVFMVQVRSKDSQVKTQVVLRIFILFYLR